MIHQNHFWLEIKLAICPDLAPPPRTKKQKNKKTFESHIVNDWESISSTVIAKEATEDAFMEPVKGKSATFKSHLSDDVAVDNLIEF